MLPLGRLDTGGDGPAWRWPASAQVHLPGGGPSRLVAERAEGLPFFLIEEVLAALIGEGALAERDGRLRNRGPPWPAPGIRPRSPIRCCRRLDGLDADSRRVICAAAVLGRRFDWALLGPVAGLAGGGCGGGVAARSRPAARRG